MKIIKNQYARVHNFWSSNYIEYESNHDKNKNLAVKKHLNKFIS